MSEALRQRFEEVLRKIEFASRSSGRSAQAITLVAVSKTKPVEAMNEYALIARQRGLPVAFGENYVQEVKAKLPLLVRPFELHMIGPLQSNKVRDAVLASDVIESVHSLKILDLIAKEARSQAKVQRLYVQVNISGDPAKSGFRGPELNQAVEAALNASDAVALEGLMTITAAYGDPAAARPDFRTMRQLREEIERRYGRSLKVSMGMSSDYDIAIEEGADLVRVGSALFGERTYPAA